MMTSGRTIVLAAGGTAGHVFPASALAREMKSRGWSVAFVTDERGGRHCGMAEADTYHIRAGGVAGKRLSRLLRSIPALAIGTLQARSLLRRLRPGVVVGFGGYASVPTMLAATYGRYKTAIHEQNAILGRANRLMAGRVDAIAASYATSRAIPDADMDKVTHTGMPVRSEVIDACQHPYPRLDENSDINLFVMGGSQGARVFSQVIPAALSGFSDPLRNRIRVVQQCREEDMAATRNVYDAAGISATLETFFDDVPARLARAHLIIGRSGASSVSEALAMGRPSILVPYPFATDDHQAANAFAVANAGAGWVMDQTVFTPDVLSARLIEIFANPQVLAGAAACAKSAGRVDAAVRLADMVERVVAGNGAPKEGREAA